MYRSTYHPRFRASEDGTILFQRRNTWHPIAIRKDGRVRVKIDGKDIKVNAAKLVWSAFNETIERSFRYADNNKQNASITNISLNSWHSRDRRYDFANSLLKNPSDTKDIIRELGQDFVDDVLLYGKFNAIIITDLIRRQITYFHAHNTSLSDVLNIYCNCSPRAVAKIYTELDYKAKEKEDSKPFFQSLGNVVGFNNDDEGKDK